MKTLRTFASTISIGLMFALGAVGLTGCDQAPTNATPTKKTQEQKAAEAANSITFVENAEIENIQRRLELTSDPGLQGFTALINEIGQVVLYTAVDGKITSGGKRLTNPQQLIRGDRGEWSGDFVMRGPSDEGTHGSSAPYVFFWTPADQYIQWNGLYLYSDKPFRLTTKPLLLTMDAEEAETEHIAN